MRLNKLIWIFAMVFISSVYALDYGRLTINNAEIPFGVGLYECGDNINAEADLDLPTLLAMAACIDSNYGWYLVNGNSESNCWRRMCCGDDDGEYFIEYNGRSACCANEDYIVDENGNCVIINASISIATLKDVYKVGEKIELTDPPDEVSFSGNDLITRSIVNEENIIKKCFVRITKIIKLISLK